MLQQTALTTIAKYLLVHGIVDIIILVAVVVTAVKLGQQWGIIK